MVNANKKKLCIYWIILFIFCTTHSLTMVFVVELWLYKCNQSAKQTWFLHFYYNKAVVTFLLNLAIQNSKSSNFRNIF